METRVNRGKDFEKRVKQGLERVPDTSVYRLYDVQGGYVGIANIADFIAYHKPYQWFVECKCCYGNTWNFHNLSKTQLNGMREQSKIDGIHCGVVLWFIDHDRTMWIPIDYIWFDMKINGRKSIKWDDGRFYRVVGKKKSVFFDYDFSDLLIKGADIIDEVDYFG